MLMTLAVLLAAELAGAMMTQPCGDIDSQACHMLANTDSEFCSHEDVSMHVCKRYCGHCPLTCFSCPSAVLHPLMCTATTQCSSGEYCSTETILSSDGRVTFKMGCLHQEACGGDTSLVGRRKRGVKVNCCDYDLCNNELDTTTVATTASTLPIHVTTPVVQLPTVIQNSGCYKSIVFMMEDSYHLGLTRLEYMKHFLIRFVAGMEIGRSKNIIGIATYDSNTHIQLPLSESQTKTEVLNAIMNIKSKHIDPDVTTAIKELSYMMRFFTPDVLVIMSYGQDTNSSLLATAGERSPSTVHAYISHIHQVGVNVISMEPVSGHLALDPYIDHVISVATFEAAQYDGTMAELYSVLCI